MGTMHGRLVHLSPCQLWPAISLLKLHCNTFACMCICCCALLVSDMLVHAGLQTIEASLNMCCGNLAGLQSQFQEAGARLLCLAHILCHVSALRTHPVCTSILLEKFP